LIFIFDFREEEVSVNVVCEVCLVVLFFYILIEDGVGCSLLVLFFW
jgi:hypothetical protein